MDTKTTFLIKYNPNDGRISGNFIKGESYKNDINYNLKTVDGLPYIEIDKTTHDRSMGKDMRVIDGEYKEYQQNKQEILENAKLNKIIDIKEIRDKNLKKPTPQTIDYEGNLSNKTFNIDVSRHLPLFNSFLTSLLNKKSLGEKNPTRAFTDASGERVALGIADYRSLIIHLDERDEQQHSQAISKINKVKQLKTVEEVEAFDVNEIYI